MAMAKINGNGNVKNQKKKIILHLNSSFEMKILYLP